MKDSGGALLGIVPGLIAVAVIAMLIWLLATNPEWARFLLVIVGLTAIGLMGQGQHG